MEPIYIASLASFMVGLFGYIIVRFWLVPIGRYLKVKGRLAYDLKVLLDLSRAAGSQHNDTKRLEALRIAVGRYCSDLAAIYQSDLPYWYQLYLESKKEQPLEAVQYSTRLVNTRQMEHVWRQANEIKQLLHINGERPK